MKKAYKSPAFHATNFSLSTGVASGCAFTATFAEQQCPVDPGWGVTIFTDLQCDYTPPGDDDQVCYHVPFADSNVFMS